MAEHIETEHPEHRLDGDALQPVGAAGEPTESVRQLAQHERHPERHHQPRQVGAAQHQEAGDETERHRGETGDEQCQHRLVDDFVLGKQRGGVGAEAEKGGMPQRDDAGIAEDQIEREREQAEPGDLGEDEMTLRQQVDRGKRGKPEHDLERMPAGAGGQPLGGGADGQ